MYWLVRTIILGLVAGYLASLLMKGNSSSLVGNIVIGIVGSFVGHFLFGLIGLGAYSFVGELIVAVAGACVFIYLMKRFS